MFKLPWYAPLQGWRRERGANSCEQGLSQSLFGHSAIDVAVDVDVDVVDVDDIWIQMAAVAGSAGSRVVSSKQIAPDYEIELL